MEAYPRTTRSALLALSKVQRAFLRAYYTPISMPDKFRFLSEFFPMLKNIVIKATLTEPGYLTVINGF